MVGGGCGGLALVACGSPCSSHPLAFAEAAQSVGDAVGSDGIWWVRGLAGAAAGMAAQALVAVPVENIRIRMLMAGALMM